jgi:hypothetical protein
MRNGAVGNHAREQHQHWRTEGVASAAPQRPSSVKNMREAHLCGHGKQTRKQGKRWLYFISITTPDS